MALNEKEHLNCPKGKYGFLQGTEETHHFQHQVLCFQTGHIYRQRQDSYKNVNPCSPYLHTVWDHPAGRMWKHHNGSSVCVWYSEHSSALGRAPDPYVKPWKRKNGMSEVQWERRADLSGSPTQSAPPPSLSLCKAAQQVDKIRLFFPEAQDLWPVSTVALSITFCPAVAARWQKKGIWFYECRRGWALFLWN